MFRTTIAHASFYRTPRHACQRIRVWPGVRSAIPEANEPGVLACFEVLQLIHVTPVAPEFRTRFRPQLVPRQFSPTGLGL